jgi:hypothetical protein
LDSLTVESHGCLRSSLVVRMREGVWTLIQLFSGGPLTIYRTERRSSRTGSLRTVLWSLINRPHIVV